MASAREEPTMAKKKAKAPSTKAAKESVITLLSWNVNGLRAVERKGFPA